MVLVVQSDQGLVATRASRAMDVAWSGGVVNIGLRSVIHVSNGGVLAWCPGPRALQAQRGQGKGARVSRRATIEAGPACAQHLGGEPLAVQAPEQAKAR